MKPRAVAHLCTARCRLRCLVGVHHRPDAETRCRCCDRKAYQEEQAVAQTRDHSKLTTQWWDEPSVATVADRENAAARDSFVVGRP